VLALNEQDKDAAKFFASLLRLPFSDVPSTLTQEEQGQVTILLGKDYVYHPLQDFLSAAQ
jgi:hypothetical protein